MDPAINMSSGNDVAVGPALNAVVAESEPIVINMPNENPAAFARSGSNNRRITNDPTTAMPKRNAADATSGPNAAVAGPGPNNPHEVRLRTVFIFLVWILVCRLLIKKDQFGVALGFLIARNLALFILTNVFYRFEMTEYALPIEVVVTLVGADFAVFSGVYLDSLK